MSVTKLFDLIAMSKFLQIVVTKNTSTEQSGTVSDIDWEPVVGCDTFHVTQSSETVLYFQAHVSAQFIALVLKLWYACHQWCYVSKSILSLFLYIFDIFWIYM